LYLLERQFKEEYLLAERIKEKRLEKSLPILNEIGKWFAEENKKLLPKSTKDKAFNYAIQRWDKMYNYLRDGNIQINNNLIDNAIRPIAIGRKNYLLAGSYESTGRSAMIYTFFANCKRHNVDSAQWFKKVLPKILDIKVSRVKTLLPSNFNTNQ
jgi:transposase